MTKVGKNFRAIFAKFLAFFSFYCGGTLGLSLACAALFFLSGLAMGVYTSSSCFPFLLPFFLLSPFMSQLFSFKVPTNTCLSLLARSSLMLHATSTESGAGSTGKPHSCYLCCYISCIFVIYRRNVHNLPYILVLIVGV